MADLDEEVKHAMFGGLMCDRSWGKPQGQRHTKGAPPAHDESQAIAIKHQSDREFEHAKALDQQAAGFPCARILPARETVASEIPDPALCPAINRKAHPHRTIG